MASLVDIKNELWFENIYVVQNPTKKGGLKGSDVKLHIDYKGKNKIEGKYTYIQNSKELEHKIEEVYIYAYNKFIIGK